MYTKPDVAAGTPLRVGARVALREHVPSDLPRLMEIWGDPEVMRFMTRPPMSEREVADFLAEAERFARRRPRTAYRMAIVRREDGLLIGTCTVELERYSAAYAGSLGTHPDTWGTGLPSEALDLVVGFAFENLKAHRVWCVHAVANERARRLVLRTGFTHVGTIHEYCERLGEGYWIDCVFYSQVDHAWRRRHAAPSLNHVPHQRGPRTADRNGGDHRPRPGLPPE